MCNKSTEAFEDEINIYDMYFCPLLFMKGTAIISKIIPFLVIIYFKT